jgi:Phage integrase family
LRSVDCLRLPYDPITVHEAGAPYLRFFNHKLSREAIIPVSQQLTDQIRGQQHDLTARFGTAPPLLLPRVRANLDGTIAFSHGTLSRRLEKWLSVCEVRDATGHPVRVTAHQFRHTVGTRMINNKVPADTVQRMLDHSSPRGRAPRSRRCARRRGMGEGESLTGSPTSAARSSSSAALAEQPPRARPQASERPRHCSVNEFGRSWTRTSDSAARPPSSAPSSRSPTAATAPTSTPTDPGSNQVHAATGSAAGCPP